MFDHLERSASQLVLSTGQAGRLLYVVAIQHQKYADGFSPLCKTEDTKGVESGGLEGLGRPGRWG